MLLCFFVEDTVYYSTVREMFVVITLRSYFHSKCLLRLVFSLTNVESFSAENITLLCFFFYEKQFYFNLIWRVNRM